MKKVFLIFFILTSFLFARNTLTELFYEAIYEYNKGNFEDSKVILEELIQKNYSRPYIYFVLGLIYREDETYNHNKAISNLKKYIKETKISQDSKVRKNRMYASINLAYQYLKIWIPENIQSAKDVLDVFASNNSDLNDNEDFKYCLATVYNSSGFHILSHAKPNEDIKYYKPAIDDLKKALKARPDFIGVVNNLAIAYIRSIEKLPLENKLRTKYVKLTDNLLSNSKYKDEEKLKTVKEYFYTHICFNCNRS